VAVTATSGASAPAPGREAGARGARLALALVVAALLAAAALTDLPRASGGEFWGDGATYYSMAWSLAVDHDLRYEARDLERVRREYPNGPQGIFLKRASGGWTPDPGGGFPWVRRVRPEEGRLYYAKAFAYPLVAAPLVRIFGTRGLLLTNALALGLALVLGFFVLLRRGFAAGWALAAVLVLFLATVAPVYLFWPTPEIFGLALVTAGLAAWASGRPLLAAALFGLAGYVKWPNVLMAAPLGLAPLVDAVKRAGWRGLLAGLPESLRRGAVLGAAVVLLFGLNAAATGEMNYQGGERKTFYGRFPFDERGTTFDSAGTWMTTGHVGPLVGTADDAGASERTGPARARVEIWESLAWNLFYVWVGRFGGALAYFGPAVVALVLFLLLGPRSREGGLALVAVGLSLLAYLWIIPDDWYGGGGTVGNRYFLNVLPAFLFVVPRARARGVVLGGLALSAVFLRGILPSPVQNSLHPGEHATHGAFRWLPAELTMLNDLSVFTEPWRKKRPFGFVGNPERHADADAYNLYFLGDGTWGKEAFGGREGFWLRGGQEAEVVLRVFDIAPVTLVRVDLTGGPIGDVVTVRLGWSRERASVGPGQRREVTFRPGRGLRYYDTYLHVLHLRSRRGARLSDGRTVGAFVEIRLDTGPPLAAAER
jgi:hypothetical protein